MIKKSILFIAAICFLNFSCSTESEKEVFSEISLVGTWEVSDVTREESSNVSLPQEIAKDLISQGCSLFTYTFNSDNTFVGKSKLNHIEVNATATGLEVDCPEQTDTLVGLWELNEDELTITDPNGDKTVTKIALDGNKLTIAGEDIDEDNYAGLNVVFAKK